MRAPRAIYSAYRAVVDFDQSPIEGEPRLFTAVEANASLADVEPIVGRMRDAAARAIASGEIVAAFGARVAASGGGRPDPSEALAQRDLADAEEQLHGALEALEALGVWVKDPARGLLDFPSEREGELVELCWLHGEARVAHWHRIGAGFAGRRPIEEDEE
jgi:hypothetical protein